MGLFVTFNQIIRIVTIIITTITFVIASKAVIIITTIGVIIIVVIIVKVDFHCLLIFLIYCLSHFVSFQLVLF